MAPSEVSITVLVLVGNGNFVGQRPDEILKLGFLSLISAFALALFNADLTAALACVVRPQ